MITEDYCSYEISKLLKEKEFDCECRDYYHIDGHFYSEDFKSNWNNSKGELTLFSAPTHQMAMKWLREKHNIIIVIEPHSYNYLNEKTSSYVFAIWEGDNYIEVYSYKDSGLRGISYSTYEEAVEAALKYTLENLI